MAQQVRTDNTSSNWWTDLWSGIAQAIGWISTAYGANACKGDNEYFDAKTGKCVSIPNCGSGTHLDERTMSCVPDIGAQNNMSTWMLVGGGILVVVLLFFVFKKRR